MHHILLLPPDLPPAPGCAGWGQFRAQEPVARGVPAPQGPLSVWSSPTVRCDPGAPSPSTAAPFRGFKEPLQRLQGVRRGRRNRGPCTVGQNLQLTSRVPAAGSLCQPPAVSGASPRCRGSAERPSRAAQPPQPAPPPCSRHRTALLPFAAGAPLPAPPRRGLPASSPLFSPPSPPTHSHAPILGLAECPLSPQKRQHATCGAGTTAIKRRLASRGGEVGPLLAVPRPLRLSPPAQTGRCLGFGHQARSVQANFRARSPGSEVRT